MSRLATACVWPILLLAACTADNGPPIVISNVHILAPLPGSNAGVAYLTITNNSDAAITVRSIRSPQFARVEMHETTISDGVSRMRPLNSVQIARGTSVDFAAGGKHIMLFGANPQTNTGSPVTLEIEHDDGLLIVSATLQTRLPAD